MKKTTKIIVLISVLLIAGGYFYYKKRKNKKTTGLGLHKSPEKDFGQYSKFVPNTEFMTDKIIEVGEPDLNFV